MVPGYSDDIRDVAEEFFALIRHIYDSEVKSGRRSLFALFLLSIVVSFVAGFIASLFTTYFIILYFGKLTAFIVKSIIGGGTHNGRPLNH